VTCNNSGFYRRIRKKRIKRLEELIRKVGRYVHVSFIKFIRSRIDTAKPIKVTEPPLEIAGVVIPIDGIKQLANVIEDEYSKSMDEFENWQPKPFDKPKLLDKIKEIGKSSKRKNLEEIRIAPVKKYIIKSADKTQYEGEDALLRENGPLFGKRITSIEMDFTDIEGNKSISIKLEHGDVASDISNNVSISGNDEIWANGVHRRLETIIGDFQKQTEFTPLRRVILSTSLSVIFGWLGTNVIVALTRLSIPDSSWDLESSVVLFVVIFGLSVFISTPLVEKIEKYYPSVELITGPEHQRMEEIRRKRLYRILSYIVIPLGLSILLEIMRSVFHY